ncbi:hypothetical protein F5Y04DRAFT_269315 [Hypomontagnella monticulosa]|nr:hypothetical protein F5Y04DRAFT_269315 [Hypomontagnella monticulosa]
MATSSHDDKEIATSSTATRPNPIRALEIQSPDDDNPSLSSTSSKTPRKRAYSIDVEEANQPRIQDLRLYTPSTAGSNINEAPRELICLCTKAPKVPRPRNAFILYRQHYQGQVAARHPGLANPEISKLIGEQWREQPEEVKNNWKRLAEEEKIRHQRQYPDYRYQPRRGGKAAGSRPLPAAGEDPGHCPKCGGRYIATPRTPSTPFSAATPEIAKPGSNMPPYVTPNPRVIETDHLRRGSTSSMMSLEGHDRRYAQPHLQHIEEDYAMMSPQADPKRRRFNGPNIFVPGSPPMGYVPADQRPGMQYQQYGYSSHPHMQPPPPPRPSLAYQPAPTSTPTRGSSSFDESLRLPPLQTQVPNSPAMAPEASTSRQMASSTSADRGAVSGATTPQRQPQHAPSSWSFLLRLEVLRSISPPLKPGSPSFETRGPLIAIEGAIPSILKEVASVVEKALSVSGEYAVKTWTDDTPASPGTVEGRNSSNSNTGTSTGTSGEKQQEVTAEDNSVKRPATGLISPLATYVARMLKWHNTSEELIQYMTRHPLPPAPSSAGVETRAGAAKAAEESSKLAPRLPVAVVADGYSLTVSDRYAALLHVNDAYRADDHWQWVATLWRGIVGADLTIYVKKSAEAETQGNNCVEFASPGVMVLRVAESGGGKGVDEKLERRLGFEIMEWVRSGSFKMGVTGRS